MSPEQNKATVRRFFDEVCNKGKKEVIDKIFAEHVSFNGKPGSQGDVKDYLKEIEDSFDNSHVEVKDQIAEGDMVSTSRVWTGTQKEKYHDQPATGKPMTWTETSVVRLADGKIAEDWVVQSKLSELREIQIESKKLESSYKNNKIMVRLLLMAITLVMVSAIIYLLPNSFGWWKEFSKSMMGLGTTVIIGGLIKLLVDEYAKNKEKLTKKREFQNELLNRLRKVFDDVDVARLLISAQRSAKTYGELIRNSIIPASVTLYDIKRSLVDSLEDQIEQNKRDELRVNIHYMLAYLRVLIAVYKKSYLQISNLQLLHEAFKEKIKKTSVELFEKENNGLFSSGVGLQQLPNLFYKQEYGKETLNQLSEDLWNKIESLEYMDDFTKEGNNTKYYTIFIEHYEDCKRILKGTKDLVRNDPPDEFENYLNQLEIIENKKKEGLLQEADNLVNIIMREKLRYSV